VYNQLLYVPVRAYKVSFPTNKVGPGQLIKAVYLDAEVARNTQLVIHANVVSNFYTQKHSYIEITKFA
jgi:hypothetical protein